MNVAELIDFLKTQPQELQVAYKIFSEQCLLDPADIEIRELCLPRSDGWVQDARPDKPKQKYLLLPGN
jgi:hypothetical protein